MGNEIDEELGSLPEDESEQVFQPNIRDAKTGLMCFMDKQFACGAACMAYVSAPRRASNSELCEQQFHCAVIVGLERLGRNVTIATELLAKSELRRRAKEQDQERQGQFTSTDAGTSPFRGKSKG